MCSHESTKTKTKEDGVRAAIHMAMGFWTLPSSQCPGCPRVNSANTYPSTQSTTLAMHLQDKTTRTLKRIKIQDFLRGLAMAHHKIPRGGAVSGAG